MGKTIYLHVGIHKTATSSLQATLIGNVDKLKDAGYFYSSTWPENHSLTFSNLFSDNKLKHKSNKKTGITIPKVLDLNKQRLNSLSKEILSFEGDSYIFSAEGISLLSV